MIRLTIDGKEIITQQGKTILEAAREGGIAIRPSVTMSGSPRSPPAASASWRWKAMRSR